MGRIALAGPLVVEVEQVPLYATSGGRVLIPLDVVLDKLETASDLSQAIETMEVLLIAGESAEGNA